MARVWVGWHNSKKVSVEHSAWISHSKKYGFEVVSSLSYSDLIILTNISLRDVAMLFFTKGWRDKPRFQILSEPRVVWPYAQFSLVSKIFTGVIKLGRPVAEAGWEYHPQVYPSDLSIYFSGEPRLISAVMVVGNKFSFIVGENYTLRRICAAELENLYVFGREWTIPLLTKLKRLAFELFVALTSGQKLQIRQEKLFSSPIQSMGSVDDKLGTMAKYKVALIIENSDEFLSEKLFDAFLAGCIPVYVGPPTHQWGIPESLVYVAENNVASIREQIDKALQVEFSEFQARLHKWLTDPVTIEKWESSNVMRRVFKSARAIQE
jgi:hypothetical protein